MGVIQNQSKECVRYNMKSSGIDTVQLHGNEEMYISNEDANSMPVICVEDVTIRD